MTQAALIPITTITFPEINLLTRDGHKLRGFFGNFFKEYSPLLHNHFEGDEQKFRYSYALVQYKVINRVPVLVGIAEAAELLVSLFLKIKFIDIDGKRIEVLSKNIKHETLEIGVSDELYSYRFENLWMGLSQKNHQQYQKLLEEKEKVKFLASLISSNILTLFGDLGLNLRGTEARILVKYIPSEPVLSSFKNQKMLCFGGTFTTNALLPDFLGLGKSVSRGFGTIVQI